MYGKSSKTVDDPTTKDLLHTYRDMQALLRCEVFGIPEGRYIGDPIQRNIMRKYVEENGALYSALVQTSSLGYSIAE